MFDAETLKNFGLGTGAVGAIAFAIWQIYLQIKKQLKDDSRSDKIDDRIDKYGQTLQATIDKLVTKIEALQTQTNDLITKNAQLSADLILAHGEAENLKAEVTDHIARIKYLESVLQEKGIAYVQ